MANENILEEFLVLIGYKHDEAALDKFTGGISRATKVVVEFAEIITATATTVAVGVARFANNLEQLYFASMRTGSSAAALKAFDRAAQDFGASAGGAMDAVEGMARFFRNNPSAGAILNTFIGQVGESAYDAQGHLKSTVEMMGSLGKLFAYNTAHGKQFMNQQIADMFGGMDEKTMLAIQNPKFLADYEKRQQYLKNSGMDKAAEDSHRFMESLRQLEDQLYMFGLRVVEVLQVKLKWSLDAITQWFVQNGPWLAIQIANFAREFVTDFNHIVEWLRQHWPEIHKQLLETIPVIRRMYDGVKEVLLWLYEKLVQLDGATGGWSTKLGVLALVLGKLGAFQIVSGLASIAISLTTMGLALSALGAGAGAAGLAGLATLFGAVAVAPVVAAAGAGLGFGINKLIDKFFPQLNEWIGSTIGGFISSNDDKRMDDKRKTTIAALMAQGLSLPQAVAIENGLEAETGTLEPDAENPESRALGLPQWLGSRKVKAEAYLQKKYGVGIAKASIPQQMDYLVREIQGADPGAAMAYMQMRKDEGDQAKMRMDWLKYGEAPGKDLGADAFRAGGAAQHTNIYIYGNVDKTTLDELERRQQNIHAELVRQNRSPIDGR